MSGAADGGGRMADAPRTNRARWIVAGAIGGALVATVATWQARTALAEGAPTTNPLYFAGMLTEDGVPVDATRDITVALYSVSEGGAPECSWTQAEVLVVQGRFRVNLQDAACAAAVAQYPDLWVQVLVGDVPLPRTKLGAVPYASEANHAVEATSATAAIGALEERLTAVEDALPKVWVNFDGTSAGIRSGHGVSAVRRVGTGEYRVEFATPFAMAPSGHASYAAAAWSSRGQTSYGSNGVSSIVVNVVDSGGAPVDGEVMFVALGEQ